MSTTIDTVKGIMAKITHCGENDINADTLLKDLKADSLHWVQIIVATETALNIEIDFEKLKEMSTINDFVVYVEGLKK